MIKKILLLIIVALLSAAAGSGGTWYTLTRTPLGMRLAAAHTLLDARQETASSAPVFLPLDTFTATLASPETEQVVRVSITLELGDQASSDRLTTYMPVVRNRILMILGSMPPQSISTMPAIETLKDRIQIALAAPFPPLKQRQNITNVLFTEFMVQ